MANLTPAQKDFVNMIVSLKPQVAAFDCDGTLWSGDAGEGFFSWELKQGFVDQETALRISKRYADYKAGGVAEDVMCGEMVTMHHGMEEKEVQRACDQYFADAIAPNIFPEMRELIHSLQAAECEVWVVSSSSQWIITGGMKYFDVPPSRILAAEAAVEDGIVTGRILRVPSGPGKRAALESVLKSRLDCAFGNAIWDREMLEMSARAFAVNPNPNLKELAVARQWVVYQPTVSQPSG